MKHIFHSDAEREFYDGLRIMNQSGKGWDSNSLVRLKQQ